MERKDPDRADPITRLIASRVHELRRERGLSGAALGAAVRALGLTRWVPSTVGKLESHRRQTVSVREWLALALALRVPPLWLLIDPKDDSVPLAEGISVDPWTATWWLLGKEPLTDHPPGPAWDDAAEKIGQAYRVATAVAGFRQIREQRVQHREIVTAFAPLDARDDHADRDWEAETAEHERGVLRGLAGLLREFTRSGVMTPRLPDDVIKRADELGVELPGQGES